MSRAQYIKGFYAPNRAWYAHMLAGHNQQPEIMIGLYHPKGGCEAEFAIRWHDLGGGSRPDPRLEIFDDAWDLFFRMPELAALAGLARNPTQDDVITFLRAHGFKDLTKYTRPEAA
jgi:hypothetical protein